MNCFGNLFRVSLFGESHGPVVGVIIDGCPAGLPFSPAELITDLERRRGGAKGTTDRAEGDIPEILSGVYNGFTTGSPVTVITRNKEMRSSDYEATAGIPRPGHADFTSLVKYSGYADMRGGGHFSGRLTWGLVVAGAMAKKIIAPASVRSELISAGAMSDINAAVEKALAAGDTIGGIVECRIDGIPAGLGEPFFGSVESVISSLAFSIPAIRAIEFGAGFAAAAMRGSEHNDPIIDPDGKTLSNNAGGINGGITNGNQIVFRVAVTPASGTGVEQNTIDLKSGKIVPLSIKGRHDTLLALRVPVVLEAVASIAMADLLMTDRGINYITRGTDRQR